MRINQNISALNAWKNLTGTEAMMDKSLERLSSGLRVNRAADDAAGLAISEKMRAQLKGLGQAQRNAEDAISLLQTSEGALNETHSILQRVRELAVQSASDTLTDNDRTEIQREVDQLVSEIDRIATTTEFNTKKLLNGSAGVSVTTSDDTKFGNMTATGDTGSGTISFSAATVATQATKDSTQTYVAATDATAADSTITFNGEAFSVASGSTVQTVIDTINNKKNTTNVEAYWDVDHVSLRSLSSGSAAYIDVTAAGAGALVGIAATKATGADATVTTADAGFASTASGNKITVTAGTYKGLTFDVKAAVAAATSITVGANNSLSLHVGANTDQSVSVAINSMTASAIGVNSVSVSSKTAANDALATIDTAITKVSSERAKIGAIQNRLEHTIANLGTAAENMTAAESRIRDVDMAQEMSAFTRSQILMQAGTAMMAQANQKPQTVLQLLK